MSADISFHVEINGSEEELSEAVRVIQHYEDTDESSEERSWDLEDIDVTIDEPDSAYIEAMGPYGSYDLEDVDLFIELAKQVPNCRFSGSIGGFSGSESVRSQAEYKDRHLVLKYKTIDESSATEEELDEFWDGDSWDRIKVFSVIDHPDENGLPSTSVELTIKDKSDKKRYTFKERKVKQYFHDLEAIHAAEAKNWIESYGKNIDHIQFIDFKDKTVVLSGCYELLQDFMKQNSITVRGAVSGKTDYLIVEPGLSGYGKVLKAATFKEKGSKIKVLLAKEVYELIKSGEYSL